MNDEELVQRLRDALHSEAEDLTPGYGTPRVTPVSVRPRRRRRPATLAYAVGAAAAVIAAAITIVTTSLGGSSHLAVGVVGSGRSQPSTTRPVPSTTTTAPPAKAGATKGPATAAGTDQLVPLSVTFVTADDGWVLGLDGCGLSTCLELDHTTDRGQSWQMLSGPSVSGLATPSAANGGERPDLQVRFADPDDGWIYGTLGTATDPLPVMWSTHDGGATWSSVLSIGELGATRIEALETAGGRAVQLLVLTDEQTVSVLTSPVGADDWTQSGISVPVGTAGSGTLVVQGSDGWVLSSGTTVTGGAELDSAGHWVAWSAAPCVGDPGPALLAASDPDHVVALCSRGGVQQVELSADSGASFTPGASVGVPGGVTALASATPTTLLAAGSQPGTLYSSLTAGAHWALTYDDSDATVTQIGFENGTQGIAVLATATGGELLTTSDGGQHWSTVDLTA